MKKLYLLLLSMIVLMSISCAFASDNTNETMINRDVGVDETITANLENVYVDNTTVPATVDGSNSVDNTNVTGTVDGSSSPKSFNDLKHAIEHNIRPGDVFNFDADYKFDNRTVPKYILGNSLFVHWGSYSDILKGIQSSTLVDCVIVIDQDNITINGNGHTIDAGGLDNLTIFKVLGNNVKITNLKFINCMHTSGFRDGGYTKCLSPISWKGNNGVMQNCVFFNNSAINGGSLSWMGNNGTIDNCVFINSTAIGVGGAIYIGGTNNSVSNCLFTGAKSLLGDAIYVDRNRKNLSLIKNIFLEKNNHKIIDGSISNIDVDYLHYCHELYAYGDIMSHQAYKVNVVPLLFKALMVGGTNDYNGLFKYNVVYDNVTGNFTFNIIGHDKLSESAFYEIPDSAYDYIKSIHIKSNITDLNQAFSNICVRHNYEVNVAQVLTRYVSNEQDYENVNHCLSNGLWFGQDKDVRFKSLTDGLKVIFTNKLTINSHTTWMTKNNAFDVITIVGNGSTINGGTKKDYERTCFEVTDNKILIVNGLTIKGFNTAVKCIGAMCIFNNVNFENNVMDYLFDRDWGAAILNTGAVFCTNCTFKSNYAKNGGAIFNQGYLSLNNCSFEGNKGYGVGNNVCVGDGGIVVVDGKNITENTYITTFAKSMSASETTFVQFLIIALSFVAGIIVGSMCLNPIVAVAVGAAVGACLGAGASAMIISEHYNINFNRGLTCLLLISGSTIAGAFGGIFGWKFVGPGSVPLDSSIPGTSKIATENSFMGVNPAGGPSIIGYNLDASSMLSGFDVSCLSLNGEVLKSPVLSMLSDSLISSVPECVLDTTFFL